MIYVTINGTPQVLIDGVMTNHQMTPGSGAESPTLTITGEDLTRVMDYIDFTGIPYPAMPPEARVLMILAKYAIFGVIPMVIPSIMLDVPIPIDRIPIQQGTDLAYVQQAGRRCRLQLLHQARSQSGNQRRVLGAGHQSRCSAARAEHGHGRAHQRGVAELQLQRQRRHAAARLHSGAILQSADSDSDSGYHAAESAAGADPAVA